MNLDSYLIKEEPFYSPTHNEVALFEAACANRMPDDAERTNGLWENSLC